MPVSPVSDSSSRETDYASERKRLAADAGDYPSDVSLKIVCNVNNMLIIIS